MQKHQIILLIVFLFAMQVSAQENWTLRKCVDYAIENNIELEQSKNNLEASKIDLLESRMGLLPNISAGTDVTLTYGRSYDDSNNVTFDQTIGQSFGIQASVNLFHGVVGLNKVAFHKYLLLASKEENLNHKNQLVFNVLSAFYTLYYSRGIEESAKKQVALSEIQFNRMQKLVDVGKESPLTVQELKSQWASDKLQLTIAQNTVRSKLLEIKQLLKLNAQNQFVIDTLLVNSLVIKPLLNVDSVYSIALNHMPAIKMQQYLLNASKKDMAISRGYVSPRLYLQAGFGTDYFDGNPSAYSQQLKDKQNEWVRLGINIPIFNGASTYSTIKRKKIAHMNQELQFEKRKDELYTEIWKALNDLQSAQNEYEASVELNEMSKLTFGNVSKKMEKGLASATDFEAAKQRLLSSEAALIKGKVIFMMRNQMLEFYLTGSWEHL